MTEEERAMVTETVSFLQTLISSPSFLKGFGRGDYMELIQLTLFVSGATDNIKLSRPAADHHARWMSKAIYAAKLIVDNNIRPDNTKLDQTTLDKLQRFCKFVSLLYVQYFLTCNFATEAVGNDRSLFRKLQRYKAIDPEVAELATKVLLDHSWYFTEPNIGLCLFSSSDNITHEEKVALARKILSLDGEKELPRKMPTRPRDIEKPIESFVGPLSILLFKSLDIDQSFMNIDPREWPENEAFLAAQKKVQGLACVNDFAERAVKMMADYNKVWTQDEEEKQDLLQVVEQKRLKMKAISSDKPMRHSAFRKSDLMKI